ncbi:hypothetical protein C2G38_2147081 [Gigaspora rosea]|uniref:Saposin B-type domain-containing protein n=1 Tax=Gigaspora rosea TaxID=44941 RepID=A0A397UHZ0_9GLOM|nr:hypothetical protein C2G38_2147081 [Gigaspora rosea]
MKFYLAFFVFIFSFIVNVDPREDPVSDGCARIIINLLQKKTNKFSYADVKDRCERILFDNIMASKTNVKFLHTLFTTDCFSSFAFLMKITLYSVVKDNGEQILRLFEFLQSDIPKCMTNMIIKVKNLKKM